MAGPRLHHALLDRPGQGTTQEFFYFGDEGDLMCLRYDNWKFVFSEQRSPGHDGDLGRTVHPLRLPKLFNLRMDPYERADITSNTYWDWVISHAFVFVPAQAIVGEFLATFKEFPPSQRPAASASTRWWSSSSKARAASNAALAQH